MLMTSSNASERGWTFEVRGFFSCSPRPFGRYCGEVATPPVRFYGPNLSQATKVTVGIVPSENAEVEELRDWKVDDGEIRTDARIAREILEFIEERRVLSVAMTDGIIGCPHQEGIDYEGEWCPLCEFWHGRDRFTGQPVN